MDAIQAAPESSACVNCEDGSGFEAGSCEPEARERWRRAEELKALLTSFHEKPSSAQPQPVSW